MSEAASMNVLAWLIFFLFLFLVQRVQVRLWKKEVRDLRAENRILTRPNKLLGKTVDRMKKYRLR